MKRTLVLISSVLSLAASIPQARTSSKSARSSTEIPPFTAHEDLEFVSLRSLFVSMGHAEGFQGILYRSQATSASLRRLDLYRVLIHSPIKIDEDYCKQAVAAVVGPPGSSPLEWDRISLFQDRRSLTACEAEIRDPDPKTFMRFQLLVVAFVHGGPFVFATNFSSVPTENERNELHEFIGNLELRQ